MSCITTFSTAVLVNGTKTEFFNPSRGIRQGDPMSSYIFILCVEMLLTYINHQFDTRKWDAINLGYNCPPLSHLFFANDLVLVGKTNTKTCSTILMALNYFCKISGQSINYKKSRIIFSKNCYTTTTADISSYLGIKSYKSFDRYLKFPIINCNPNHKDYLHIIDNMRSKLSI